MRHPISALLSDLKVWLAEKAYPLWWRIGADHELGGFQEKISPQGEALSLPKRARVQPRQIYSFAQAAQLGWEGDAVAAIRHGVSFYLKNYRRADGLFRNLVDIDGQVLNDKTDFYDQAFALLGLHSAYESLDTAPLYRDYARTLFSQWSATHKHPLIGFEENIPRRLPLCANPHMHLLESCLAWHESDPDGPWHKTAHEIVELCLTRLIDARTGALREFFDGDWQALDGEQGRIVEPGHQFEWAWLLMRWSKISGDPRATAAAMRLIEIAETYGVDRTRGVAFNSMLDDFSAHDRRARLWPQTERMKAHCLAAEVTGQSAHWDLAAEATKGLMLYLQTPISGLWWDVLTEQGSFIEEPAPASSFYHIVCAIKEMDRIVGKG
jgi:mannose-6-phosphate isomerase